MGRGRQKAKHTKVARDLKYFSPDTNYTALERELMIKTAQNDEYVDKWADAADDDDTDDDDTVVVGRSIRFEPETEPLGQADEPEAQSKSA